tara:strand:+ start:512 stop:724 length:213 start_codon:yes stop_codon:yes gene_type:complete
MIERISTVARSAVTYLTLGGVVLQLIVDELSDELPSLIEPIGRVIAGLAVAVAIVRRVSPVFPEERGLTS